MFKVGDKVKITKGAYIGREGSIKSLETNFTNFKLEASVELNTCSNVLASTLFGVPMEAMQLI